MAAEGDLDQSKGLFDEEPSHLMHVGNDAAQTVDGKKPDEGSKHAPKDIEQWLMDSLKDVIPADMHDFYINKNNALFAYQDNPLQDDNADHRTQWLQQLTSGGKRTLLSSFDISTPYTKIISHRNEEARKKVALDYRTDPCFMRVIDSKTGKYILANLVRAASEQRAGIMNYVDYLKRNVYMVPLLEELNRYALLQKIAYKRARKQLWFIMAIAEELKLVERTKSFMYKIVVGKDPGNDQNSFLLDRQVTAKWMRGKPVQPFVVSPPPLSVVTKSDKENVSMIIGEMNGSFDDKSRGADPSVSMSVGDIGNILSGLPSMTTLDGTLGNDPSMSDMADMSIGPTDGFDSMFMGMSNSNSFTLEDSFEGNGNMVSFRGAVTNRNWNSLELSKSKKSRSMDEQNLDNVQKALERIGSRRGGQQEKTVTDAVVVLEAACKLYGTGPKWSNPDKAEFEVANKRNKLVYVKPPKNVDQSSIAYHYLMQYKSVHQKLNGGIRQQYAVAYGLITFVNAQQGGSSSSFNLNPRPWDDPLHANKWKKLGLRFGNFWPWAIASRSAPKKLETAQEKLPTEDAIQEEPVGMAIEENNIGYVISSPTEELHSGAEAGNETTKEEETVGLVESSPSQEAGPVPAPDKEQCSMAVEDPVQQQDEPINLQEVPEEVEPHTTEEQVQPVAVAEQIMGTIEETEEESREDVPENPKEEVVESTVEATILKSGSRVESEVAQGLAPTAEPSETASGMETTVEVSHAFPYQKTAASNTPIDPSMDAPGPVQLLQDGMKQMKLTELFRYVYTKMKKVKQLPECSPELLGKMQQQNLPAKKKRRPLEEAPVAGKKKRILDDDFVPEALNLNYAPIQTKTLSPSNEPQEADEAMASDAEPSPEDAPKVERAAANLSKKEKIHKMREFLKNMFEVEAEESEDENLSDPEDIRKKLLLLKERLQNSEAETDSDLDTDTEIPDEMKDFIGEVEKLNEEDEELARQRYFADMQKKEDDELAKLMPLKERSEREMTRREGRMKLLMQLKNAKDLRDIKDLHLSDFESSDEEEAGNAPTGKKRPRISKEQLEKLLKFKDRTDKGLEDITKTEQLQQFVDFKLQGTRKQTGDEPVVKNQVETVTRDRRAIMDNMLSAKLNMAIFGEEKAATSADPFSDLSASKSNISPPALFGSSNKPATFVMKSFRWDHSAMKPLNSTNTRNVGGFTGFHSLHNALREEQARNEGKDRSKTGANMK